MDFFTIMAGLLFSLILTNGLIKTLFGRDKKLPPGPRSLPIIGNLHLLSNVIPHSSLAQLAKTYGPIMFLRLGFKNTVVISSAAMAKEVLQKQDLVFSSRTILDSFRTHNYNEYSVELLPVGPLWRTLRKFLRANFFSGNCLDASKHIRRQKVEELVEYCRKSSWNGEAVDLAQAFLRTLQNILWNIIFSKDMEDQSMKDLIVKITMEAVKPNVVDIFPIFRPIDPQGIRRRLHNYLKRFSELLNVSIDERMELKKSMNKDENVIDILLALSELKTENIGRPHIEALCLDLLAGGTETTLCAVEWAMAEALRNPDITKRVKDELEQVIGKGNILNEEDIECLPYLQCVVKETFRLHPPGPFLIPRTVKQDVEVCGYTVPKDSLVVVNTWAIGRDPDTWVDPLEFKPERFLDSSLDVMGKDFELIPFGAGRRMCPGLELGKRMVTVMLGSLLNSFDWKLEGDIRPEKLNMEERFGAALRMAHPPRAIPIPL